LFVVQTQITMSAILESLKQYFENNTDEQIGSDWAEFVKYDSVGPKVDDFMNQSKLLFSEQPNDDNYWDYFFSNQIVTNPKFASDFF
jgi:hypothetical protein